MYTIRTSSLSNFVHDFVAAMRALHCRIKIQRAQSTAICKKEKVNRSRRERMKGGRGRGWQVRKDDRINRKEKESEIKDTT